VELGPHRRHDITAGGGVGETDGGVPGLDRRRVTLLLERELLGAFWERPSVVVICPTLKSRGYGLNLEVTETGVAAIGRRGCDEPGQALGAITIAIPSARFSRDKIPPLARELALTTERAAPDLARCPER
jgi:hypothetical protein